MHAGTVYRALMEAFADSPTSPLQQYRLLYPTVLEYALTNIVERRVESEHAKVKRRGRSTSGMSGPRIAR